MADYTVTLNTYWDSETGYFTYPSPANLSINVGDRVRFRHVSTASTPSYMLVYMETNSWFTPSSTDSTLSHNEYSSYYTSSTTGTIGVQFRSKFYYYGYSSYVTYNITSANPYVQYTGGRNMNDIGNFLGDSNPKNIANWYRGGTSAGVYVPNIPDGRNNSVPTWSGGNGPTITLNDFVGVWKNG